MFRRSPTPTSRRSGAALEPPRRGLEEEFIEEPEYRFYQVPSTGREHASDARLGDARIVEYKHVPNQPTIDNLILDKRTRSKPRISS